ncbi:MAG: hypothetical protein ACK4QW_02400 [Alphaproteobacteria bacterium]
MARTIFDRCIEASCAPMQVLCCAATHALIADTFACVPRGDIDLKGFGATPLYGIERELAANR